MLTVTIFRSLNELVESKVPGMFVNHTHWFSIQKRTSKVSIAPGVSLPVSAGVTVPKGMPVHPGEDAR